MAARKKTLSESERKAHSVIRSESLEETLSRLSESEEYYRLIVDQSADAMMTLEPPDWRFSSGNPAIFRMFGVNDMAEFTALEPWALSPETQPDGSPSREKAVEMIETAMRKGSHFFDWTHRRLNGESFPATVQLTRIEMSRKKFLHATVRDITVQKRSEEERNRLQQQLLQAQKMESIGRLAGGVAHDFNNMLSIIRGQSEIARKEADPSSKLFQRLQLILSSVDRSAGLVAQLLAFARKQPVVPQLIDVNRSVAEMFQMLQTLLGEEIRLNWQPGDHLGPVRMDPSQISQILVNLCINSRDAIENEGLVTVRTFGITIPATGPHLPPERPPGEYTVLEVKDNGCGMDQHTVSHLFEPFFTTKEIGRGSGLGLATIYGIVRQNNGFIDVSSTPAQGSTFTVYLPVHRDPEEDNPLPMNSGPDFEGRETILLVEDESDILEVMTEMLEGLGYSVIHSSRPQEALRLSEEHRDRIQLLITDIIMPETNGLELSRKITGIIPGLKTLFMSGYTADIIGRQGVLDPQVRFLQKPFSLQNLAEAVAGVLRSPSSSPAAAGPPEPQERNTR